MPSIPAATAAAQPAAQAELPPEQIAVTAAFDETKWKSPEVTRVVAYDPFALPSAFPHPVRTADGGQVVDGDDGSDAETAAAKLAEAIESLQTELRALQERGVHVIIRGRDQYVAMIGDRTVHVGDEIERIYRDIDRGGRRTCRKEAERMTAAAQQRRLVGGSTAAWAACALRGRDGRRPVVGMRLFAACNCPVAASRSF